MKPSGGKFAVVPHRACFSLIIAMVTRKLRDQTNFSDPGYIAVWLLRDEVRSDAVLGAAVGANWIEALLGHFNNGSEHYQETAALAYDLNADATLRFFCRDVKNDDERHGDVLCCTGFRT